MPFTLNELTIIERLLSNRLSADNDYEIEELLHKVRRKINETNRTINRVSEWNQTRG